MPPSLLELLIAAGVKPPMACCLEYVIKETINDGVREAESRIQQNLKREIEREVRRAEIRINLQRTPATDVGETKQPETESSCSGSLFSDVLGDYFKNRRVNFWYPFASGKDLVVCLSTMVFFYCFGAGLGVAIVKVVGFLFFNW